ncbi:MAG: hypothetical protein JWL63_979 [Rhodocyclales bacterium]|nr:hypothetical protein [Rhodocyclales bacterium]
MSDGYVKLFFVFDDVWRTLLAKEARDIEVTPLTKSEIMSAARAINVMKRGAEWMSWEEMEDKAEYGAYLREIDKIE